MPLDFDVIRELPTYELKNLKERLILDLEESHREFRLVETKLKEAIADNKTRFTELAPLISFRDELKQVLNQNKNDLEMVNRLLNGVAETNPGNNAPFGGGTVLIRNNDANNKKIAGAKTYQQILDDQQKEEERCEIMKLEARFRKLEEFRNMEQSKKQTQKQMSTQSQTSK